MLASETFVTARVKVCLHCGDDLPFQRKRGLFCCTGCHVVYDLIHSQGLNRFYELRPKRIRPLTHYFSREEDLSWVDHELKKEITRLILKIDGLQCSACVWLIREIAKRHGKARVDVEPILGRLEITCDFHHYPIKEFLRELKNFGYHTAPYDPSLPAENNQGLVIRLGICAAIAMNTMFLAFSLYAGLNQSEPLLYSIFTRLNFWLSLLSVVVGGSYFFQKGWRALKKGIIHFDLPISLGILFSFMGSAQAYWRVGIEGTYFDTVNIFVALMLTGRLVQERFLAKNRRAIIQKPAFASWVLKRKEASLSEIQISQIQKGDQLIIRSGELLPVSLKLEGDSSSEWSLEGITGESVPKLFKSGEIVSPGSILISRSPVFGVSQESGENSSVLFKIHQEGLDDKNLFWRKLSLRYLVGVLMAAGGGAFYWGFHDPSRIFPVLSALFIVTCPCSLGLSIPLAQAITHRLLSREGVLVRKESFFEKAQKVKKIFFDKTGTLTLSDLTLGNRTKLDLLSIKDKEILFSAAAQSRHPVSRSIFQALLTEHLSEREIKVTEILGEGLHIKTQDDSYFLGRPQDLSNSSSFEQTVVFQKNGKTLTTLFLKENYLGEARQNLDQLRKKGFELFLLSGDAKERVLSAAQELGFNQSHAFFEKKPQDKEKVIQTLGKKEGLMVGDGLNDCDALTQASLSGTPLGPWWQTAQRSDFVFASESLSWLNQLFSLTQRYRRAVIWNISLSAVYNLIVITGSVAGWIHPLAAAIAMPISSITSLAGTTWILREKRA